MSRTPSAVAGLLLREMVRDRLFLALLGGAGFLLVASLVLNEMVVGEPVKASRDLGLSLLGLFPLLLVVFLGIGQLGRDLYRHTLYILFARSLRRRDYLLGGYLAVLLACALAVAVMALAMLLLGWLQGQPWALLHLGAACWLALLEAGLLLGFAVLFAVIVSPPLAMFLALLLYVIGHSAAQAAAIVAGSANVALRALFAVLALVLPDLELLNHKAAIAWGHPPAPATLAWATLYAAGYALLALWLASRLFERREL